MRSFSFFFFLLFLLFFSFFFVTLGTYWVLNVVKIERSRVIARLTSSHTRTKDVRFWIIVAKKWILLWPFFPSFLFFLLFFPPSFLLSIGSYDLIESDTSSTFSNIDNVCVFQLKSLSLLLLWRSTNLTILSVPGGPGTSNRLLPTYNIRPYMEMYLIYHIRVNAYLYTCYMYTSIQPVQKRTYNEKGAHSLNHRKVCVPKRFPLPPCSRIFS